jgi:hypothetical protein
MVLNCKFCGQNDSDWGCSTNHEFRQVDTYTIPAKEQTKVHEKLCKTEMGRNLFSDMKLRNLENRVEYLSEDLAG